MKRIYAIAGSVVADAARRKVLYAVLAVAAVMTFAIPSLPSYGVGVVGAIYREVSLAVIYAAAVLVTIAMCANRIPGEVERRTVYNVLAKRVGRWEYIVGTWLGVFVVMGVLIAAFAAVDIAIGALVYHEAMWRLLEGAFAIWLEAGVLAAAAVAVSSRIGPVPVTLASLTFLFVAHSRQAIVGSSPSLIGRLYPSLDVFAIIDPVSHGSGVPAAQLGLMVVAFAGWILILLALGSLAFQGRDL
jgi:ABC-type transport system involved in multi-copper enzyme maturation permease subunit